VPRTLSRVADANFSSTFSTTTPKSGDIVTLIVSAKEDMQSSLSVCLSVSNFAKKITSERIFMKFSGKVCNGPTNKLLNFGVDPDSELPSGYGNCFPDSSLLGDTGSG